MDRSEFVADLEFRRLWHQDTGKALRDRLSGGPVTAYIGFDPTSDSLHVGHLLQMCMLRRLDLAGHRPIALCGGGTGLIGDPGGRSDERPILDKDRLRANLEGIRRQLERFIDFSGTDGPALVDNGDWLVKLDLIGFLRDIGKHFSVNEMIKRESVMARIERSEQGISFTEFSYMLLQAYDFLHLFDDFDCRLQIGGSDQFGNILMGVELIRKLRREEVFGLTSPLVLKADGTKFGKSESGTVWLDAARTSPYQLHQFFLRTDDSVVGDYLRYFTFLDHEAIRSLDEACASHPERRQAQRALAYEVCAMVHGDADARRAEEAAEALYSNKTAALDESALLDVLSEAPSTTLPRSQLQDPGVSLVDVLCTTGLATSKGQARTLIAQGGVYVNDDRATGDDTKLGTAALLFNRYLLLRRGKQEYHLVRFE